NCSINNGINFRIECAARVSDGELHTFDNKLVALETKELILAINIGTDAKGNDPKEEISAIKWPDQSWDELFEEHLKEYNKHYGRLKLELSDQPAEDKPTDERMEAARKDGYSSGLAELYFNYGRYLLCASSATAELPAHLQGKWNEDLYPPWESDYHHNINLQMNYWIAEPAGMHNYAEALLQHIERFVPHAEKAATDLFGCRGVWFPIQSDAWGKATPEAYGWAVWMGAAAWLAQHVWWHYEFGQDLSYLKDRAYPFLKKVVEFYEDFLIEDENGVLQFVPSQSPENRFVGGGELPVTLCVSATMDVQLAWDVITHSIKAAQIQGTDADKQEQWNSMLNKLPKLQIGSKGQLLEWNEEFEEVEPGHRHVSHLFGLHPGEQICPDETPELFKAAKRSLELRLESFGGHTGWSRAWTACFFARFGEGDEALRHVIRLVTDFSTDSLLDLHPPRIFQIDGNLGGAAAVLEMLFQSYKEVLDFLPALPKAWQSGKINGLRARGGYNVGIEWDNGKLAKATVSPLKTKECIIRKRGLNLIIKDDSGSEITVKDCDKFIKFVAEQGREYKITPV
ncbi:MAG: glycoside hydrolase family 95 protein, partial [Lentisphaerae bacterium]|nr:glycoside hydrolase family 95 protein [Lentisphaerota bacterium]